MNTLYRLSDLEAHLGSPTVDSGSSWMKKYRMRLAMVLLGMFLILVMMVGGAVSYLSANNPFDHQTNCLNQHGETSTIGILGVNGTTLNTTRE
jgi:hypothetical protein